MSGAGASWQASMVVVRRSKPAARIESVVGPQGKIDGEVSMLVRRIDLGDARDQGSARHGHGAALREHTPREPSDWHRDGELGRLRFSCPPIGAAAIGNADAGTTAIGSACVDGGIPRGRLAVRGAHAAL